MKDIKQPNKLIIFIAIAFIVGLILGGYVTQTYLSPILNKDAIENQETQDIAYDLLAEEVNCYIKECNKNSKELCSRM